MKAICTHCGKPVTYDSDSGLYVHKSGRWPDDNGYYCFENISQFSADPRPMEEIIFRKDFSVVWWDDKKNEWLCKNPKTGEVKKDPFHNSMTHIRLGAEIQNLKAEIERLKSWLGYYQQR